MFFPTTLLLRNTLWGDIFQQNPSASTPEKAEVLLLQLASCPEVWGPSPFGALRFLMRLVESHARPELSPRTQEPQPRRVFLVASDCCQVARAAVILLRAEPTATRADFPLWSFLHLDGPLPSGACRARVCAAAQALRRTAREMAPGRMFRLSYCLVSPEAAALPPSPAALLQAFPLRIEERSAPGEREHYAVNGDNWHAEGPHGLYPSLAQEVALERLLAAREGIAPAQVVSVAGGIAAAFDLVCQAFGLFGGRALVVGPAYGGLEQVLLLREIVPRQLGSPDASAEDICRAVGAEALRSVGLVLLTHPALYTAADLSAVAEALAHALPAGSLLILDECYAPYLRQKGATSSIDLIGPAAPAVAIGLRSLSKLHGQAGLRVGYTVSAPHVAQRVRSARLPKSIASVVMQAACEALSRFSAEEALRRESQLRRALIGRLRRIGLPAGGEGPYVVVRLSPQAFRSSFRALRAAGIHLSACTAPVLVYQPSGGREDKKLVSVLCKTLAHGTKQPREEQQNRGYARDPLHARAEAA